MQPFHHRQYKVAWDPEGNYPGRISGTVLTPVPAQELHFDCGPVASLPMTPARLANLDMVKYPANGSIYSTSSGIPGPSLADATWRWKDHLVT